MVKHEYRIISRRTEGDLGEAIESFLNSGWQLVGGVCMHTESEYTQTEGYAQIREEVAKFYQAITRSWNPVPPVIGKVVTSKEEVLMYSEN